ncbi:ferritin-like domain-containing protein [Salinisphaera aquimarina]|uniref:Ferritin-like domain-containing protein n=1 Tax=Salinisphaera aquimarina TaxID=2094031 RepID=A0ABV7EJ34_9GAMM
MTDEVKDDDLIGQAASRILTPGKINNARRRFLTNTGMFSAGLIGSTLLAACNSDYDNAAMAQDGDTNPFTDIDILNFALNLEYLEAEFYLYAATGSGIPREMTTGTGMQGTVSGGAMVNFADPDDAMFGTIVREYANEIAVDEYDHVKTLRGALGSAAVAEPQIALDTAFRAALGADFDYTANPTNFLLAAFIFEDVGVTAYKGAAPLIQDPNILSVAAGFLAAESYHSGLIRTILYSQARRSGNQDLFNTVQTISNARDSFDDGGAADKDQGIAPTDDVPMGATGQASNIVPLDDNGVAYGRTPDDVLNVVYLTADEANQGGFFPAGTNGYFKQSSAAPASSSDT